MARGRGSPTSRKATGAIWIPCTNIPDYVQKAFVTAEDKRFYQHKGIDERGLIRALITNLAKPGASAGWLNHHPAGGQEPGGG